MMVMERRRLEGCKQLLGILSGIAKFTPAERASRPEPGDALAWAAAAVYRDIKASLGGPRGSAAMASTRWTY